jgi:ribosomal protein S18 acetylase RimI-like enzyme
MVEQDALDILCEVFDTRIEDVMASRDGLSYTAYDHEGYPVGAVIYEVYTKDEPLPFVYLQWLGVRYVGVGIGGHILRHLHQQFPTLWFSLSCRKNNTNALAFYKHFGYEITGDLPGCPDFYHLQRQPEQELT